MANVKVAVRVRPPSRKEVESNSPVIVDIKGDTISVTNLKVAENSEVDSRERISRFVFDFCYWSIEPNDPHYVTQESIFNDLGTQVLESVLEGYNACVLAYGQSGSGKTYTMMGIPPGELGLIPRICENLFSKIQETTDERATFHTDISFLEIYNERVCDLLQTPFSQKHRSSLKVREHPKLGPYVQDLTKHEVSDFEAVLSLIERGNRNRSVASTETHTRSSRSHAIFTINFTQACLDADLPSEIVSKIHLVDLAGSERANSIFNSNRLKEGSNINKSLVTLGNVISALAEQCLSTWSLDSVGSTFSINSSAGESVGASPLSSPRRLRQPFVPYRDSVLTWLLKDSLGGNSKTIMVTTISPVNSSYTETIGTLRYAQRAKSIVNKPVVNEDPHVKLIRELRAEISRLRELLAAAQMNNVINSPRDEVSIAEILNQNERKAFTLTKSWMEKWQSYGNFVEDSEMCIRKSTSSVIVDSPLPHLVTLDNHILSTGIKIIYLKEGKTIVGNDSSNKADIGVEGTMVLPEHCELHFDGTNVVLTPTDGSLCRINEKIVREPTYLRQADILTLGEDLLLRFNHPSEVQKLRQETLSNHDKIGGWHDSSCSFVRTSPLNGLFCNGNSELSTCKYGSLAQKSSHLTNYVHCCVSNQTTCYGTSIIENQHRTQHLLHQTDCPNLHRCCCCAFPGDCRYHTHHHSFCHRNCELCNGPSPNSAEHHIAVCHLANPRNADCCCDNVVNTASQIRGKNENKLCLRGNKAQVKSSEGNGCETEECHTLISIECENPSTNETPTSSGDQLRSSVLPQNDEANCDCQNLLVDLELEKDSSTGDNSSVNFTITKPNTSPGGFHDSSFCTYQLGSCAETPPHQMSSPLAMNINMHPPSTTSSVVAKDCITFIDCKYNVNNSDLKSENELYQKDNGIGFIGCSNSGEIFSNNEGNNLSEDSADLSVTCKEGYSNEEKQVIPNGRPRTAPCGSQQKLMTSSSHAEMTYSAPDIPTKVAEDFSVTVIPKHGSSIINNYARHSVHSCSCCCQKRFSKKAKFGRICYKAAKAGKDVLPRRRQTLVKIKHVVYSKRNVRIKWKRKLYRMFPLREKTGKSNSTKGNTSDGSSRNGKRAVEDKSLLTAELLEDNDMVEEDMFHLKRTESVLSIPIAGKVDENETGNYSSQSPISEQSDPTIPELLSNVRQFVDFVKDITDSKELVKVLRKQNSAPVNTTDSQLNDGSERLSDPVMNKGKSFDEKTKILINSNCASDETKLLLIDPNASNVELKRTLSNNDIQQALQLVDEVRKEKVPCPLFAKPGKVRTDSWPKPSQLSLDQLDNEIKDLQDGLKEELINEMFDRMDDLTEEPNPPAQMRVIGGSSASPSITKKLVRQSARLSSSPEPADESSCCSDDSTRGGRPDDGIEWTKAKKRKRKGDGVKNEMETVLDCQEEDVFDLLVKREEGSVVAEFAVRKAPPLIYITQPSDSFSESGVVFEESMERDEDEDAKRGGAGDLSADESDKFPYSDDFESDDSDESGSDEEDEVMDEEILEEEMDEDIFYIPMEGCSEFSPPLMINSAAFCGYEDGIIYGPDDGELPTIDEEEKELEIPRNSSDGCQAGPRTGSEFSVTPQALDGESANTFGGSHDHDWGQDSTNSSSNWQDDDSRLLIDFSTPCDLLGGADSTGSSTMFSPIDILIDYRMLSPMDRHHLYTIPELSSEYSSTPTEGILGSVSEVEGVLDEVLEEDTLAPLVVGRDGVFDEDERETTATPVPGRGGGINFSVPRGAAGLGGEREHERDLEADQSHGESCSVVVDEENNTAITQPTDANSMVHGGEKAVEGGKSGNGSMMVGGTLSSPDQPPQACRELWKLYKQFSEDSEDEDGGKKEKDGVDEAAPVEKKGGESEECNGPALLSEENDVTVVNVDDGGEGVSHGDLVEPKLGAGECSHEEMVKKFDKEKAVASSSVFASDKRNELGDENRRTALDGDSSRDCGLKEPMSESGDCNGNVCLVECESVDFKADQCVENEWPCESSGKGRVNNERNGEEDGGECQVENGGHRAFVLTPTETEGSGRASDRAKKEGEKNMKEFFDGCFSQKTQKSPLGQVCQVPWLKAGGGDQFVYNTKNRWQNGSEECSVVTEVDQSLMTAYPADCSTTDIHDDELVMTALGKALHSDVFGCSVDPPSGSDGPSDRDSVQPSRSTLTSEVGWSTRETSITPDSLEDVSANVDRSYRPNDDVCTSWKLKQSVGGSHQVSLSPITGPRGLHWKSQEFSPYGDFLGASSDSITFVFLGPGSPYGQETLFRRNLQHPRASTSSLVRNGTANGSLRDYCDDSVTPLPRSVSLDCISLRGMVQYNLTTRASSMESMVPEDLMGVVERGRLHGIDLDEMNGIVGSDLTGLSSLRSTTTPPYPRRALKYCLQSHNTHLVPSRAFSQSSVVDPVLSTPGKFGAAEKKSKKSVSWSDLSGQDLTMEDKSVVKLHKNTHGIKPIIKKPDALSVTPAIPDYADESQRTCAVDYTEDDAEEDLKKSALFTKIQRKHNPTAWVVAPQMQSAFALKLPDHVMARIKRTKSENKVNESSESERGGGMNDLLHPEAASIPNVSQTDESFIKKDDSKVLISDWKVTMVQMLETLANNKDIAHEMQTMNAVSQLKRKMESGDCDWTRMASIMAETSIFFHQLSMFCASMMAKQSGTQMDEHFVSGEDGKLVGCRRDIETQTPDKVTKTTDSGTLTDFSLTISPEVGRGQLKRHSFPLIFDRWTYDFNSNGHIPEKDNPVSKRLVSKSDCAVQVDTLGSSERQAGKNRSRRERCLRKELELLTEERERVIKALQNCAAGETGSGRVGDLTMWEDEFLHSDNPKYLLTYQANLQDAYSRVATKLDKLTNQQVEKRVTRQDSQQSSSSSSSNNSNSSSTSSLSYSSEYLPMKRQHNSTQRQFCNGQHRTGSSTSLASSKSGSSDYLRPQEYYAQLLEIRRNVVSATSKSSFNKNKMRTDKVLSQRCNSVSCKAVFKTSASNSFSGNNNAEDIKTLLWECQAARVRAQQEIELAQEQLKNQKLAVQNLASVLKQKA